MKKKRYRSLTAITLSLSVFTLILWLASMFSITIATAQNFYDMFLREHNEFSEYVGRAGGLDELYDKEYKYLYKNSHPSILDNNMLRAIELTNSMIYSSPSWANKSINVLRDEIIDFQTAVIFYDKNGNIIHQSGDFIYFPYVTEDSWKSAIEEDQPSIYAYIDLGDGESDDDPYAFFRSISREGTNTFPLEIRALRITGYFEGTEIKPYKISLLSNTAINQALEKMEPTEHYVEVDGSEHYSYEYTLSNLDRNGLIQWQTVFDNTDKAENKDELITIYTTYPQINVYDECASIKYQDDKYDSLLELLSIAGYQEYLDDGYPSSINQYSLNELIIFNARAYRDFTNYSYESEEPVPEPDFIMLTAISSKPLSSAISELRNVYIATFIIAALGVLILRSSIKLNMTQPLKDINKGISDGWTSMPWSNDQELKWKEIYELHEHYSNTQDKLRMNKNELTRLNTALDYAKKAEQNRRQMISNIAHELKTPLAIIHSYSEGLKEKIAEEKREHYLDVILSESERMDAMVLELLDLSRLEAGKVKLSRDDFSLTELTASIFEKLHIAAEGKGLQISFDFEEDCVITADEARIGQVITNFASNAIKYTAPGGRIHVRTYLGHRYTEFSVENESKPFTNEELTKVWETFYRSDSARTGGGTGLGLAIAKSIIDLHGGRCFVRNTKNGVEFGFTLPS